MRIDFSPLNDEEMTIAEFARRFTIDDLRAATHASIDALLEIIGGADDAQIAYVPHDPEADDPFAPEEDRTIGWSLSHLVLHVTASSEEGAAFSSLLARGIPIGERLRYEPDWRTYTTREQVLQRLEESRRMRLTYLDTWPDEPHLYVCRQFPEDSRWYGQLNATGSFLLGLKHEVGHYDQLRQVAVQAHNAVGAGG